MCCTEDKSSRSFDTAADKNTHNSVMPTDERIKDSISMENKIKNKKTVKNKKRRHRKILDDAETAQQEAKKYKSDDAHTARPQQQQQQQLRPWSL